MTAKDYLSQARKLNARINAKFERLMRLRALSEKQTTGYGVHVAGGNGDRFDIVVRIVEKEQELNQDIDQLLTLQDDIERAIYQVEDDDLRSLLEMRYLAFMKWEKIAECMGHEVRWVHSLHGKALSQITANTSLKCTLDM